jgi:hypothetical protein
MGKVSGGPTSALLKVSLMKKDVTPLIGILQKNVAALAWEMKKGSPHVTCNKLAI